MYIYVCIYICMYIYMYIYLYTYINVVMVATDMYGKSPH